MACEKEEHLVNKNNEQLPQNPKDMVQNKFIFQWDTLIDDSKNDDEFFIGNQYIGVQRWECLATSPHIYVGATFPKSSFATTFDRENIDKKHPIDLTFNFPIPYITCMEDVKGSEYLQKIKEALKSKEFQSYTSPQRPYIIKFAELKSLSNIENCFPYNKEFGNALKKIAQQEFNMKNIKSLCISEVIFKGFTISMDVPSDGLFIAPPSSLEELVYIRTLTYGVTAYFVIASNNSYQNVLEALLNSTCKCNRILINNLFKFFVWREV
ncbi:hypothetical protein, partial [Phocaeicola vulgatus]|uniref:hypothetical protein n=1 Tax=Phocaeicola vulgatus TaxID=821 RepID=UPI0035619EC5